MGDKRQKCANHDIQYDTSYNLALKAACDKSNTRRRKNEGAQVNLMLYPLNS